MHNLSTISKTYGKHQLKATASADGLSPVDPTPSGGSESAATAIPARMNVSSGISAGMAMPSSSASSTALSLSQGPVLAARPVSSSQSVLRHGLSARLPPLNIPTVSNGVGLSAEELSVRGTSPILPRPLEPLKSSTENHPIQNGNQQATQSLNSTVVNEVHAISYDRRRRPSSAQLPLSRELVHGHIPSRAANISGSQGFSIHKPLPGISVPNKNKNRSKKVRVENAKASPWRFMLKCLLISLFLSIPVVIFILMMALSGGFATVENVELRNGTTTNNTTNITTLS